jgi:hypothetical protein
LFRRLPSEKPRKELGQECGLELRIDSGKEQSSLFGRELDK